MDQPRAPSPFPASTTRRRLAAFYALAIVFSWSALAPILRSGGVIEQGVGWPTHFPALLGPLTAAALVTAATQGRDGLRELGGRMARWRLPLRWWLAALSPLGFLLLALVVDAAIGHSLPSLDDFGRFSGLPSVHGLGVLGIVAALVVVNGLGEESGWRGFALPELQRRHGPLASSLLLVPLWAAWHLPMFPVLDSFRGFGIVVTIGWIVGLACGAIVLTWLYNSSGGSILLVAVWHGLYNVASGTAAAEGVIAAIVSTLVMGQAMLLVLMELRHRRRLTPESGVVQATT